MRVLIHTPFTCTKSAPLCLKALISSLWHSSMTLKSKSSFSGLKVLPYISSLLQLSHRHSRKMDIPSNFESELTHRISNMIPRLKEQFYHFILYIWLKSSMLHDAYVDTMIGPACNVGRINKVRALGGEIENHKKFTGADGFYYSWGSWQ